VSVNYLWPDLLQHPIESDIYSWIETGTLAQMPYRNIGPLKLVLDGSIFGGIKSHGGDIVRCGQADHQVAGHLLGAADAEARSNMQHAKPFGS